jgi:hypothetical protein
MWTPAGGMIDLGTLPGGGGQNVAAGMNATGQVVGWSGRRIDERAVVWTAGSGRVELRSLDGVYTGGSTRIDTGNRAAQTRAHPFLA